MKIYNTKKLVNIKEAEILKGLLENGYWIESKGFGSYSKSIYKLANYNEETIKFEIKQSFSTFEFDNAYIHYDTYTYFITKDDEEKEVGKVYSIPVGRTFYGGDDNSYFTENFDEIERIANKHNIKQEVKYIDKEYIDSRKVIKEVNHIKELGKNIADKIRSQKGYSRFGAKGVKVIRLYNNQYSITDGRNNVVISKVEQNGKYISNLCFSK